MSAMAGAHLEEYFSEQQIILTNKLPDLRPTSHKIFYYLAFAVTDP